MENEVRPLVPMIYYHVWDNYPAPKFNRKWYDSCDKVVTISKVTSDIVQTVSPTVDEEYLPHAVDHEIFKKYEEQDLETVKKIFCEDYPENDGKFVFFWNNRNARRKLSGSVIFWFKQLLDEVGEDKACLLMHTEPRDPHGQPLDYLIDELGLADGQVMLSTVKVPPEQLAKMYNFADCTINIADAEGFGLSSLESLSCETPVINTMTGGLQEQVTDGKKWFGVGVEPASKAVIGSLDVPYIYEDRVNGDDVVAAMKKMLKATPKQRATMGKGGRRHLLKNYSHEKYVERWDNIFTESVAKYGPWGSRQNHAFWKLEEIA